MSSSARMLIASFKPCTIFRFVISLCPRARWPCGERAQRPANSLYQRGGASCARRGRSCRLESSCAYEGFLSSLFTSLADDYRLLILLTCVVTCVLRPILRLALW